MYASQGDKNTWDCYALIAENELHGISCPFSTSSREIYTQDREEVMLCTAIFYVCTLKSLLSAYIFRVDFTVKTGAEIE
jgi:hypothetical protein